MRVRFSELLEEARGRRGAVGAFTCYNLETAVGVLEAAKTASRGVMLLISPAAFAADHGPLLVAALGAIVAQAEAPACLQLDHASDLALIEAALTAGVGAVMADGSRLDLPGNLAFVAHAQVLAGAHDAEVEAELGRFEGDEDVAEAAAAGALTDPDEARRFVEQCQVACLAVSIGNVHGTYARPPQLDVERLAAIQGQTDHPLALHGASGLGDAALRAAIARGACKINVNTELRQRYLAATAQLLPQALDGARVLEVNAAQAEAVAEVVAAKLAALESGPDADPEHEPVRAWV